MRQTNSRARRYNTGLQPSRRYRWVCTTAIMLSVLTGFCSCNRGLTMAETSALLTTADILTVHDAERLLRRLLTIQARLGPTTLADDKFPPFTRWQVVEPFRLTAEEAAEDGFSDTDFRPLIVIAKFEVSAASPENEPESPPEIDDNAIDEVDVDSESTPDTQDNPDLEQGYIALLPVMHGSSAVWPVVIVNPNRTQIVSSNLRDFFATAILEARTASTDDTQLTQAVLTGLWTDLQLGLVDADATDRRNTVARTSSDTWLTPPE